MKLQNPFLRPAEFLADHLFLKGTPGRERQKLDEQILTLSFGRSASVREYHVKKIADLLFLFTALLAAVLVTVPLWYRPAEDVPGEGLKRGDYAQSPVREELLALAEGESEAEALAFDLHQRTFTSAEAKALLADAKAELEAGMLGDNPSRDEVRSDLDLPSSLQDGFVSAEYLMVPYGIVSEDGKVSLPQDSGGEVVQIRTTLTCQDQTLLYDTDVHVLPRVLSDRETWWNALREHLTAEEETSRSEEYFTPPGEVEGKRILWRIPGRNDLRFVLLFLLLIPVLVYCHRDEKIRSMAEERQNQLLLDYPDLLWKLNMLLGAGLTIRTAFGRIGEGYTDQRERGVQKKRYVYEELLYTLREMGSGIPESEAYLNFGKRCALPGYLKLGTLLEQNVKKGSTGLAKTLETEAEEAMDGRINAARKKGEQAGTRLLFPMILMLGVVLVILMVPALMVMG